MTTLSQKRHRKDRHEPYSFGNVLVLVEGLAMITGLYTYAATAIVAGALAFGGGWKVRLDRTHGVYFPFRG